jgi:elongation factor G
MRIEIVVPEEYLGDVIGDLNSRRGRVEGMEARGGTQTIRGFVPLSEMFGYTTSLRSLTQGRGTSSMDFFAYEEMPKSLAEEVVKIGR